MQIHWWYSAGAALGILLGAGDAAADGMRCGNRLVSKGDTTYAVRSRCGEPSDATRRVETRTERRRVRVACGRGDARCERVQEVSADVVIDEWVYDFGPQQFVRYLTFVDGKLFHVETGSYGTNP
jgi:NAD(P)H-hydrate repair Nnr-like enzyme with NAD(P)H-hydrate epimerase domain